MDKVSGADERAAFEELCRNREWPTDGEGGEPIWVAFRAGVAFSRAALAPTPTVQQALSDEVRGTFDCPICGEATPHEHTGEEVAKHRSKQKRLANGIWATERRTNRVSAGWVHHSVIVDAHGGIVATKAWLGPEGAFSHLVEQIVEAHNKAILATAAPATADARNTTLAGFSEWWRATGAIAVNKQADKTGWEGAAQVAYSAGYDAAPATADARAVVEALEETQGLLVAMMHETRPVDEIEKQIHDNRNALEAFAAMQRSKP